MGLIIHSTASSENFTSGISEDRYDAFISFRHALNEFWLLNANLRQSFFAGRYAPFAPSLGTEFRRFIRIIIR